MVIHDLFGGNKINDNFKILYVLPDAETDPTEENNVVILIPKS